MNNVDSRFWKGLFFGLVLCLFFWLGVGSVIGIDTTNLRYYYNFNSSLNLTDYTGGESLVRSGTFSYVSTPLDYGYNNTGNISTGTLKALDSVANSITGNLSIGGIFYIKGLTTDAEQGLISKYYTDAGVSNRSYKLTLSRLTDLCKGNLSITISSVSGSFTGVSYCSNYTVPFNQWVDIVVTFYAGSYNKIYINGVSTGVWNGSALPIASSIADSNSDLAIGNLGPDTGTGVGAINGSVEEAWGFARILSDDEVLAYHNNRTAGFGLLGNVTSEPAVTKNISIDSNFDSGSINSSLISGNTINFTLKEESVGCTGYDQCRAWTYFKVSNLTIGTTYTFNVNNVDSSTTNPWNLTGFQMVRSCNNSDRSNWTRISTYTKTSSTTGQFTFVANCNDTYIAEYFPYSYTDGMNYYSSLSSSYLTKSVLTTSTNYSRNVTLFKITNSSISDSDKFKIVVIARQHPNEVAGSFFVEGMVNYLLNSSKANFSTLLNNYVFYIITPLNPDGVYNGTSRRTINNVDMNRAWNITSILDSSFVKEVNDTNNYLKTLGLNNKSLFLDVHGNGGQTTTSYLVDLVSTFNSSGFYDRSNTLEDIFYANSRFIINLSNSAPLHLGIAPNYYYQNYSGNVLSLGLEVALFSSSNTIDKMLLDGENVTQIILKYYGLSNVSMCSPLWVQNNSICNGVNYTILYYDSNLCNVSTNLPVNNGTIVYCGNPATIECQKPVNNVLFYFIGGMFMLGMLAFVVFSLMSGNPMAVVTSVVAFFIMLVALMIINGLINSICVV